jgi:RsiW-degrading membrane proteinase PrsW (M82 family)
MTTLFLLIISILPVVLLGFYIYEKDSEKEPGVLLLKLFASGFLAAVMVLSFNLLISKFFPGFTIDENASFLKLFFLTFFEVALIEEFSKWLMIVLIGYKSKEFDQLYDIIVYSVFVALGFAMLENMFYVFSSDNGMMLGFSRAILSVPGHVCFGIFMGVFLGFAKTHDSDNKITSFLYMILAVLVPTLLHTVYNFCLMADKEGFFIIFIAFVLALYVGAVIEVDKVSKDDSHYL